MECLQVTLLLTLLLTVFVSAFEELPKFSQLLLLYPGYHLYGGRYRDSDIAGLVGTSNPDTAQRLSGLHNTASLRLSFTLIRYGGRHSLPRAEEGPILLSKHGRDSVTGDDGYEYIFRNTAFGPYLAAKYGEPRVVRAKDVRGGVEGGAKDTDGASSDNINNESKDTMSAPQNNPESKISEPGQIIDNIHLPRDTSKPKASTPRDSNSDILSAFRHRQGIIRMVNYNHHHAAGHVGLWDCDHFVQSRDWSHDAELIAIEFWESPDSYCPQPQSVTPNTASVTLDMSQVQIVVGHNVPVQQQNGGGKRKRRRHHGKGRSRGEESRWIQ